MRIPISWLKEYVKLPEKFSVLTDKLTMAGHLLDKIEKFENDTVIDLELRGNRSDCYSILGIAREVSALFNTPVKYPQLFHHLKKVDQLKETKYIINTPYVQRAMMVAIEDVKICPSPEKIQKRLRAYGIPPINSIVDLTNYVMLETGEPMHVFDLEQIGENIQIRLAKEEEKMTTFMDKTLTLTADDLVWANDNSILSIAGAIGEKYHSISDKTKNIIVEAANYDQANIRRTIYRHNILTDAGIRHEKELDPNLVEQGISRFLELVEENGWGKIKPLVFDYYPKPVSPWKISLNYENLSALGGVEIEKKVVKDTLKRLNFEINKENEKGIEIVCPTYRTDVKMEEDVIEEVLRIYGYEKIPAKVLSLEIPTDITPPYIKQEFRLKTILTSLGFNEVISSSFVKEADLKLNFLLDGEKASPVEVENPPSPDVCEMRMSLVPNLLNSVSKVINERGESASFLEVGKTYFKKEGKYQEKRKLGIIYWTKDGVSFPNYKGLLEALFSMMHISNYKFEQLNNIFDYINSYNIKIDNKIIGSGGQVNNILFTEVDLDSILGKSGSTKAKLWPKYPPQIEDINLIFPDKTYIGEVKDHIKKQNNISDVEFKDIFKDSYTFRIWYQDPDKTLTDEEVKSIREKMLKEIKEKFGATLKN